MRHAGSMSNDFHSWLLRRMVGSPAGWRQVRKSSQWCPLDRGVASFARADADALIHWKNENFAVTNLSLLAGATS